jgi:hypothetical protein
VPSPRSVPPFFAWAAPWLERSLSSRATRSQTDLTTLWNDSERWQCSMTAPLPHHREADLRAARALARRRPAELPPRRRARGAAGGQPGVPPSPATGFGHAEHRGQRSRAKGAGRRGGGSIPATGCRQNGFVWSGFKALGLPAGDARRAGAEHRDVQAGPSHRRALRPGEARRDGHVAWGAPHTGATGEV